MTTKTLTTPQPRPIAVRTLTGTPEQVRNTIDRHAQAGTLIAVGQPVWLSTTDSRVRVAIRVYDTEPPRPATRHIYATVIPRSVVTPVAITAYDIRHHTRWRTAGIIAAIAAPVAGLIFTIIYAINALVAFITEHAAFIVGLLTVIAIIAALLTRTTGGNSKRHCPGC